VSSNEALDPLVRSPESRSPVELARDLVEHALSAGGRDNVTVAVVDIAPELKESS
jgi:serine/threonine protein phosphatase PrpC